ncbi:hypothetical protein Leryth_006000 [Lithospermum erythrorhizon]|nr:hypothetical protein Leryth_006000 [Lithospermum erythrorhizon]
MKHSTGERAKGKRGKKCAKYILFDVRVRKISIVKSTQPKAREIEVRLSAHTAIQFYDVQDSLGYDRPSKAVDWLFKQSQNAIDKLAELPPWCPNVTEQADLSATTSLEIQEQNN